MLLHENLNILSAIPFYNNHLLSWLYGELKKCNKTDVDQILSTQRDQHFASLSAKICEYPNQEDPPVDSDTCGGDYRGSGGGSFIL